MVAVALLVVIGSVIPSTTLGDKDETLQGWINPLESLTERPTKEEIKQALIFISQEYGLDETQLLKTVECESDFKYTSVGLAGEIGVLQYMPSTWNYWNKERKTNLNIYSTKDQLNMVVWAWNKKLQHHWTCYRNLYDI